MTAIEALRELVACKDMKDALDDHAAGVKLLGAEWFDINEAYRSRKPLAWKAAREAISAVTEVARNPDTARLDALEKDINENGPLLLHNLRTPGGAFRGLGLACTERSLRKAIDDMTYANANETIPSPLARSQEKP